MIAGFSGEYRFLSNFYPCKIEFMGIEWSNVECAYQWAKTLDPELIEEFRSVSPGKAKRMGASLPLTPDWNYRKIAVMTELVTAKFMTNPELAEMLIHTSGQRIVELNVWNDKFWGMIKNEDGDLVGKNLLGDILELVRMKLLGEGLCV